MLGRIFTIRFPKVRPDRTITPVESIFSTSLVAVPAFMRVLPVSTSGPVAGVIAISAACARADPGTQLNPTVSAPKLFAYSIAPSTYGVRPLAAMPTRVSGLPSSANPAAARSRAPSSGESSECSLDSRSAESPPAINPWTNSAGTEKVGGHSLASSTPSRPLVPAPI